MKLYNFTSNTYGPTWFVCAENREAAIEAAKLAVKAKLERMLSLRDEERIKYANCANSLKSISKREDCDRSAADDDLKFIDCCANNLPQYHGGEKCSLDEVEPRVVIMSEVS